MTMTMKYAIFLSLTDLLRNRRLDNFCGVNFCKFCGFSKPSILSAFMKRFLCDLCNCQLRIVYHLVPFTAVTVDPGPCPHVPLLSPYVSYISCVNYKPLSPVETALFKMSVLQLSARVCLLCGVFTVNRYAYARPNGAFLIHLGELCEASLVWHQQLMSQVDNRGGGERSDL